MNFEISLLPALGGYWLLTHLIPTRTEALRQSGYHIAFRSAVVGLLLFVLAYFMLHSVEACASWRGCPCLPYTFPTNFENAAMTSAALGLLGPYLLNLLFDAGKAEERVAAKYGDLVELLIAEAIKRTELMEVSLRTGKSYIGFVIGNTISRWPEADLALLPVASGYRNKDTQELEITTDYATALHAHSLANASGLLRDDPNDFRIVIPRSEIVSARLFDPELHQKFQEAAD